MKRPAEESQAPPGDRLRLSTGAEAPERVRTELVEEVRRRMEEGELDSELALMETALALLDGDHRLTPT